jgi:hypothetical protein
VTCLAACVAATALSASAAGAIVVTFDENTYPINPLNTLGAFTFSDFAAFGAVTDGPASLILDVQDVDGQNGVWGGVGVDYIVGGVTTVDFDPATHQIDLAVKILANNQASAIRAGYIDDDAATTGADQYVFQFDLSGVPVDGQFHVLSLPMSAYLFVQTAFPFTPGNGVQDPGLRQMTIESQFGSTGRLNVEVDYVTIRAVPEPALLGLLAGAAALPLRHAARRRRNRSHPGPEPHDRLGQAALRSSSNDSASAMATSWRSGTRSQSEVSPKPSAPA